MAQVEDRSNVTMVYHNSYISAAARLMQRQYLAKLRLFQNSPTFLNLASGLPNPDLFPFKEATFTLKSGEVLHLPQNLINVAFQYSTSEGDPELVERLKTMTTKLFAPPHMAERGLIMTAGGNAAIYIILHTFIDPGDYVFLPEATYPSLITTLKTTEAKPVPVPIDCHGLQPDLLRAALKDNSAGRRKLLYVVPNGDNPTGNTLSEERRREIYNLACEYDFLIVEDDPYYFNQYGSQQIPPSFLSLDTEGRVLRIDSFSKTIGAGLRLAYVTADKPFVHEMQNLNSIIMCHAPVLSQVVMSELLRCWGHEGFMHLTKHISQTYQQKRDVALEAAAKHLSGLCEWKETDGMFLWLKVLGLEDVREMVEKQCSQRDLILVPGSACMWDDTRPSPYIRVSYSLITPETADKGFRILEDVIREELKKTRAPEK